MMAKWKEGRTGDNLWTVVAGMMTIEVFDSRVRCWDR